MGPFSSLSAGRRSFFPTFSFCVYAFSGLEAGFGVSFLSFFSFSTLITRTKEFIASPNHSVASAQNEKTERVLFGYRMASKAREGAAAAETRVASFQHRPQDAVKGHVTFCPALCSLCRFFSVTVDLRFTWCAGHGTLVSRRDG